MKYSPYLLVTFASTMCTISEGAEKVRRDKERGERGGKGEGRKGREGEERKCKEFSTFFYVEIDVRRGSPLAC
jgi:hypothetical protein